MLKMFGYAGAATVVFIAQLSWAGEDGAVTPQVVPTKAANALHVTVCCRGDNDLFRTLVSCGYKCERVDSPAAAVNKAVDGGSVMILADDYPGKTTAVEPSVYETAARKKLRLYVEYPSFLPEVAIGTPRQVQWERAVVVSNFFGPALSKMRIITIQGCSFLPVAVPSSHLVLARVSGYDNAVLGLPGENVQPLLFEHPRGSILVATTKLSQVVTARYAPDAAWGGVWQGVLGWLNPGARITELKWTPDVRPSYGKDESLPRRAERQAVLRGAEWYRKSNLLVHSSWRKLWDEAARYVDRTGPGPAYGLPAGDGSEGLLEGFSSAVKADGTQPVRWFIRADCNSEAAMAIALSTVLGGDKTGKAVASNLLDYVDFKSPIQQGPRADPKDSAYGLFGWDTRPEGTVVYYGDDNARAILSQLAAAAVLKSDRWDESILRCILANFRTTGPSGYRNARIDGPYLERNGWRSYWEKSDGQWGGMRHSPHYQAYLWAVNLWLYDKTKFKPLLDRSTAAIRHQMSLFPDRWDVECGRQESEYSRMLLPLAWLVRIEDTPEHRRWLMSVAEVLIAGQDPSGAIRQRVTKPAGSNEQYGTGECALIHATGDPCTDLLYTDNFALLGLHEAVAVTGDKKLIEAENRLAGFLVRIQARSSSQVTLDGVWFRGFDYSKWDYWGSNGDIGWGVWSTESGWTQGWITSVLAMRQMKTSLWDLVSGVKIDKSFDKLRKEMLP